MADDQFGDRLRTIRHGAGMSQAELASKSGVPKTRLSRYENKHILPSLPTLTKLARALECAEASLLGEQTSGEQQLLEGLHEEGIHISSPQEAAMVATEVALAIAKTRVAEARA